jgi:S1-C subfamily serine protease
MAHLNKGIRNATAICAGTTVSYRLQKRYRNYIYMSCDCSHMRLLKSISIVLMIGCPLIDAAAQVTSRVKDIPTISHDSAGAVALVIVSDKSGKPIGQGSGFVVSKDGRLITNHHVIEKASTAVAKFPNGAYYLVAGVLADDKEHDIAILKLDGRDFQTLALGDSGRVQVGEEVVAIGSPLSLETTVSNGIIGAIRQLGDDSADTLQITAPISPGSSGGPLFNMRGEVIGITAFQLTQGQNLNFAIPINLAKRFLNDPNLVIGDLPGTREDIDVSLVKPTQSQPDDAPKRTNQDGTFPREWIQTASGSLVTIRVDGDYLYEQGSIQGNTIYFQQATFICDTKKQGSQWIGKCSYTYTLHSGKRCSSLDMSELITVVSPQRIEGESEQYLSRNSNLCPVAGGGRSHFVLIPAN